MKRIALAVMLAVACTAALADDGRPLHLVLGTGLTFGGEKLTTVTYTNGDEQDIRSGGLFAYYAGLDLRAAPHVSFQATVGYHTDNTSYAKNGGARFSRIPVEVLGYFHVNDTIRIGGGARLVNSPHLKGKGVLSDIDTRYDNTVGVIVEGEYRFTSYFGLKLRAVSESYRPKGGGEKANGDHVGVYANFYL